jgi:uncharacterized lipoprotein YehR (DUF1307 family)
MKAKRMLFYVLFALLVVLMLAGCASGKYVPKPNEELYGTWINEKMSPQKLVNTPDGWKQYLHVSDSTPFYEGTRGITRKWTDSEGNIWYETFSTFTSGAGDYNGKSFTVLEKLSKSATVLESVWTMATSDQELKTPTYPSKIDPKDSEYSIYYRAGD